MDIATTTVFIFVLALLLHGDFCFPPTVLFQTPWSVEQNNYWACYRFTNFDCMTYQAGR